MDGQKTRVIVLAGLFLTAFAGVQTAARLQRFEKKHPTWAAVPYRIENWRGQDDAFDPVYGGDPADSTLLRAYRREQEPSVILYVGFFGNLSTILDVHTPELCYPAEGWAISGFGPYSAGKFRNQTIPARSIVAEKGGNRRLVVWWYNAGPRPIGTRMRHIYAMLMMSTFTGRTDGSMVRLETPIDDKGEMAARKRIDEFRGSLLPKLDATLPQ